MAESIEIREERQDDVAAIRDVNRLAFGQSQEGEIVDALRANRGVLLSLVAVSNGTVVGHVLYCFEKASGTYLYRNGQFALVVDSD